MSNEKCIIDPQRDCLGLQKANMLEKQITELRESARGTHKEMFDRIRELEKVEAARQLNEIALRRGQTLAEMALAWVLKDERMTSVIVGASSVNQLADNLKALDHLEFTADELKEIEQILPE